MRKLITLILILAMFLPAAALAEYPLSKNEQNYVGSWNMYIDSGNGTVYVFIITFLDNMKVVQRSMVFTNGELTKDNKASGDWLGFTSETILFTLAGTEMTAMIKDDGYLYMYFFKDISLCGIYSRCENMVEKLGW